MAQIKQSSKLWLVFNRFDLILKSYIRKQQNQQEKKFLLCRKKKFKFFKKGSSTLSLHKRQLIKYKFLKSKKIWLQKCFKQFKIWFRHFVICISVLTKFLYIDKFQKRWRLSLKVKQYFNRSLSILIDSLKKLCKIFYLFAKSSRFVNRFIKLVL